ncbi:hypothetical protein L208DRAFT_1396085 [Tricholoma matsutake]|nr:hypothetical protein L208DRAFT_1396085 [Tricholoma matsutake 945]
MTLHDPNTHEAPLLEPEARRRSSPFELDNRDQNAPVTDLPSYRATKSKSQGWRSTLVAGPFQGWNVILFDSWFNVLIVMIPIAWTFGFSKAEARAPVLVFCLLALMPLVKLHDLATHDLALRIGGSMTGLLNASLSNIVATVVSIIALVKCELRVVQSTLIGIILGKLLLVLGLCFFAGGIRFYEQGFDATATQMHSTLLTISVGALLLPAVYHFSIGGSSGEVSATEKQRILNMSHAVSIILLITYVAYLIFQLFSHTHLYNDRHNKQSVRFSLKPLDKASFSAESHRRNFSTSSSDTIPLGSRINDQFISPSMTSRESSHGISTEPAVASHSEDSYPRLRTAASNATLVDNFSVSYHTALEDHINNASDRELKEAGEKQPRISLFLTVLLLVVVTGAASVTAEILVRSMDNVNRLVSKEWVALILLPAVTSLAESMTAINVSVKDRLSLSISIAVGGALQTALLIIPFMVILSWVLGKPLSLLMDPFETLVLYISVQTMSHTVADGKSNWLEGLILLCLYVVIAVSFWFYPGSGLTGSIGRCDG